MSADVKVYGADWCEDTHATRQQLDRLGIAYEYINVESDARAQAWVKQQNGGKQRTPTVDIRGRIIVEPDENELVETLKGAGVMG